MRSIVLFCVLFIATVAWAENLDIVKATGECVKELGIKKTKELLGKKEAKDMCLAKCIVMKTGIMDDKGVLIESKIPEKLKTKAKDCDKKATDTDLCKRAKALQKCMFIGMKKKD